MGEAYTGRVCAVALVAVHSLANDAGIDVSILGVNRSDHGWNGIIPNYHRHTALNQHRYSLDLVEHK